MLLLGGSILPAHAGTDPVTIQIRIDGADQDTKPRVKLGETFSVILTVNRPAGTQIFAPSSPDISPFRLRRYVPPTNPATGLAEEHRYELIALRLGPRRIPKIEITYRLSNGESGALQTKRMKIFVANHLQNDQELELAPPPEPVPVKATNWGLLWFLSVIGAALGAALLTLIVLRVLRDRLIAGAKQEPIIAPNELALTKLEALELSEASAAIRYAETIDVLREYLGGRFRFDGLESTTAELKIHLIDCDLIDASRDLTTQIVEEADLIKFAKMTPGDEEARTVISQVKDVVITTWVEPDPEENKEDNPLLESASRNERLKSGLLDTLFFGLPCLIGFFALWFEGELQWGWLPIALFCGLMVSRDLIGNGSPGKKLLGLRLATRSPQQHLPALSSRLGRNALLLLAPVGLPVETLVLAYNPITERLGDRWFNTDVVHREGFSRTGGDAS